MKTKLIIFTLLAFIGLSTANAQVGIGTPLPDNSAILDVESTTQGFLPPRLTTAQRDAVASPAEGLTIYNTDNKCLETYNGTDWISLCDGSVVTTLPSSNCPDTTTTIVDVDFAGHTWMDRNLGASQVATSTDDTQSYGDLYQWGRCGDGHEKRTSGFINMQATTTVPNAGNPWDGLLVVTGLLAWASNPSSNLWQGVTGTNNPCPAGYRIPTITELQDVVNTFSPNTPTAPFASPLKLPTAGYRAAVGNGNVNNTDDGFYYGVSSNSNEGVSFNFGFNDNFTPVVGTFGATGPVRSARSLRCIKD